MTATDTVYLTGRDAGRVSQAVGAVTGGRARVRGELLDVADPGAAGSLAARLADRHGGIDIAISNAVMRVGPDDDPREIVDAYSEVNNFGTTRVLRAFRPAAARPRPADRRGQLARHPVLPGSGAAPPL